MSGLTRRHLLFVVPLILLVAGLQAFLVHLGRINLKSKSTQLTIGMRRKQVEEIICRPPAVELGNSKDAGKQLVWVDQFWQLDVKIGPDLRVQSISIKPSDSPYRRTVGRWLNYP